MMEFSGRVAAFLDTFQQKHVQSEKRRAVNLLVFQLIYLVLLTVTILFSFCVNRGVRLWFYSGLLIGLMVVISLALVFNLRGRFHISIGLTAFCMVIGPWISILLDPCVGAGDFMPLIYVSMSIQLCSILLKERLTIIIASIQLLGVGLMIVLNPALRQINWPSLVMFIVFTATIGVLYGFSNTRQLEEIDKQRNQLMLDEAKLRALSVRDPLTGLYNRRYMEETFDREIQRAIRKQQQLCVIMADIDGFKEINDTVGHVLGDKVLIKVSALLMKNVRASDVACRFGGDEFCLILPDCTLEEGVRRAETLRRVIERLGEDVETKTDRVTLSLGVAAMPESGVTREALMAAADSALYTSKRAGRNRVNGIQQNQPY